jgi:hypothetical protein
MTDFQMAKRAFSFSLKEGDFNCVVESEAVTTDEVIGHIVQFLRGCGYQDESIYDAMGNMVAEYTHDNLLQAKETVKTLEKRRVDS